MDNAMTAGGQLGIGTLSFWKTTSILVVGLGSAEVISDVDVPRLLVSGTQVSFWSSGFAFRE